MKVYLGADHGGFEMKNELVKFLKKKNFDVEDIGPKEFDSEDDYTDYAVKVAGKVAESGSELNQKNAFGILICRSAGGVIIASNKIKGIRAVAIFDETSAKHARGHNDANIAGISGDWTLVDDAKKIAEIFLTTPFSNASRHTRRLKKIQDLE